MNKIKKYAINSPLAPPRRVIGLFSLSFARHHHSKSPPWRGFRGGSDLYKSENHFATSIIDELGNLIANKSTVGKMIATGFDNMVMPLIRYDTQDFAQWHGDECEFCHRKWPILERIEGRAIEFIYDKNMKKISITAVIYGQHLKAFKNIKKMQLFQNRPGEVSVRIVKNQAFDASDAFEIKHKIENVSPDNLLAALEYVDDIPSRKNGKFQFLVQEIK